jgi:hypothetical protein
MRLRQLRELVVARATPPIDTSWWPYGFPPLAQDIDLPPGALLIVPACGQVLYRLLSKPEPRLRDFMSNHERTLTTRQGDQPPVPRLQGDPFDDWCSVSMYARPEQAVAIAQRWPTFVQAVHLAAGNGFSLARTEADIDGHYDVWGDPQALLDHRRGEPQRHDEPAR